MSDRQLPDDPPHPEAKPDPAPKGREPLGVPKDADLEEPLGTPSSDRHDTETVANKT